MTFSLRAWIIFGKQNTRKGSVIRSLTGLGQSKWCEVALVNGQRLRLWGQVTSPNEGNYPPAKLVEDCLNDGANQPRRSWYNLLIPIRLDIGKPGFEAEDYIEELVKADAWIESIITLGEPTRSWVPECGVSYGDVPDVNAPTNKIGEKVRQFWGWL
jgi:hypothetical protein